ncbi:MAG: PAS domain S-box protein [Proteobacteria bacterium]|nr:PAS domain S-box protein [Pseudomonadota bacterium]MBU1738483.1 PAS domain S-box protein [Pseudomonadota bacterium]
MKLNRIILLLTAITLAAIIASGSLFYFNLHNSALSETHLAAEINVRKLAEKLDTVIMDHHQIILAIAGVWEVKKAVRETEKDLLEFANEALKHFQTSLNGEVLYLMDQDGTVRASSNYDEAGSFVGKNYAFRPYFKEAINGKFGAYPALGVTTNQRGLYLSCPVYPDENGVVGGVLVFKISTDHFQDELSVDTDGLYLLASPEGLIFMSTFEKFNSETLWPLDKDTEGKIISGRQFGKGPWPWSGFSFSPGNRMEHRVRDQEGSGFMVHKHEVKRLPGWRMIYLHDTGLIFERTEKPMLRTVGSAVLALCLLFSLLATFLYRFATKEIMRRQHAEKELQNVFSAVEKAKKEWEGALDSIDDMIVIVDESGIIKRLNRPFAKFTGDSYREIIGREWSAIFARYALSTGKEFVPTEPQKLWHEKSKSWLVVTRFDLETKKGDGVSGFIMTISDETALYGVISELDQRNYQIEENRAKLEKALEELSSIIRKVSEEKDFKVRFRTPDFPSCFEILGCTKTDCKCYGEEGEYCWMVSGTLCECSAEDGVENGVKKSCLGCEVYKTASRDPICRIGEEFNHMMHILEHKNNELQGAYQELKQAQSQILQQEKMASVGQLAAGVAHEINNPMGFIGSNLTSLGKYSEKLTEFIRLQGEMLEKLNDPTTMAELQEVRKKLKLDFIVEDMHDLITESLDGADRVKKIVMGLKNFSRVDQAEQQMANMNECVDSTLNVVWNELKYKCTVEKDYGDIPQIMCFPQQLNQVFMNMLVNGAQAIEEQGVITIRTFAEDGFVNVAISDTGCGISPEHRKRIFEPFFTTKDVGKGTGLGMSIAWDIVKKHGGEILIDSEMGKGSTFTVKLPVEREAGVQGTDEESI